jgi:hypothetical protein
MSVGPEQGKLTEEEGSVQLTPSLSYFFCKIVNNVSST